MHRDILFLILLFCVATVCSYETSIASLNNTAGADADGFAETDARRGWTARPKGRGTLDILWSCSLTMFLCSWSVLCLNIPGPHDTQRQTLNRKFWITCLAFIGPEFIFQIALGQLLSARRSVKDFHASGYTQWTITYDFFADMGGFVLQAQDWPPFPLDAKQLHYLLVKGYISFPAIDERKIKDRNKTDGLLRLLTFGQTLWFAINLIGRGAQALAITCAELTTVAFIFCSAAISLCWMHKPADVGMTEIVEADASIAEILVRAGDQARRPYSRTPLDFVSRKESPWSLCWSNSINLLRRMGVDFAPRHRPVDRFENTQVVALPGRMVGFSIAITAMYAAIFLCGWNYDFPTRREQVLWRVASMSVLGCPLAYWILSTLGFQTYPAMHRFMERRRQEISR